MIISYCIAELKENFVEYRKSHGLNIGEYAEHFFFDSYHVTQSPIVLIMIGPLKATPPVVHRKTIKKGKVSHIRFVSYLRHLTATRSSTDEASQSAEHLRRDFCNNQAA